MNRTQHFTGWRVLRDFDVQQNSLFNLWRLFIQYILHWLAIHCNVLWSATAAAAVTPKAQLSEVMQEFRVGWFLVSAILPSGGREGEEGINRSCLEEQKSVSTPGEVFCFCFFYLYFLSFSSKTFFFFSELCDRKRKYLQQNEKIRTFPLKEVGLDSDQISRRWNDCWTGIKRRINVILISKLSTNKMLHSVHFLKLT